VLWRLLEGLQHGVEGVPGEHVHFVDHIDLVAPLDRGIHRLVQQRRHVVHATVRGRIHLHVIGKTIRVDGGTGRALVAGCSGDPDLAVQGLGQDAGDGGLADTARAGEQVGVVQAPGLQGMGQRTDNVLLPDERLETARAPLAGKYLISHGGILTAPTCAPADEDKNAERKKGAPTWTPLFLISGWRA
jgi:hypothetical protein